ncbi:MAG: rplO [Candidatus Berkelbacteria bacterium]|nr:rplO [Candidatus Berkelbacteria bacterium]
MQLHELVKIQSRAKKRLGRGHGSGKGTTSGRGTKGQKSRSGYNIPRRFEGGQMPWIQRLPKKRGFKSRNIKPEIVKLSLIDKNFKSGDRIEPKILFKKGLIRNLRLPIKILVDKKIENVYSWRGIVLTKKYINTKIKLIKTEDVTKDLKSPNKTKVAKIDKQPVKE